MSLYKKYRPTTVAELAGNEEMLKTFTAIFSRKKEDLPHAVLFTGPSGCGKTTLGRIAKNLLGCSDVDYYEYNTADFNGIDMMRDIRQNMAYAALDGEVRVWLIDECHMLSKPAQEAFLKMLEDTPSHVFFFLATTEPEKLKPTIKGRCTPFTVKSLSHKVCERLVQKTARREGVKLPEEVIKQIASDSLGSARMALVILDKIIDLPEADMLESAKQSAAEESECIELCRALINGTPWKKVSVILKGLSQEPESTRRQVLGYANSVLLNSGKAEAGDVIDAFADNFFDSGAAGLTLACYELCK